MFVMKSHTSAVGIPTEEGLDHTSLLVANEHCFNRCIDVGAMI